MFKIQKSLLRPLGCLRLFEFEGTHIVASNDRIKPGAYGILRFLSGAERTVQAVHLG